LLRGCSDVHRPCRTASDPSDSLRLSARRNGVAFGFVNLTSADARVRSMPLLGRVRTGLTIHSESLATRLLILRLTCRVVPTLAPRTMREVRRSEAVGPVLAAPKLRRAPGELDTTMISHDVRDVCSIAGNTTSQPVPAGVNGDQRSRPSVAPCGRRVVIGPSAQPGHRRLTRATPCRHGSTRRSLDWGFAPS
jgi:hypothetical protein